MATENKYKQCILKMGNITHTAWLPSKFAKVGKFVVLEKEDNTTWEVTRVGPYERGESYLLEGERDYKHQREASDI